MKQVSALSVRDFFARFPDEDSCLRHVMELRYGLRHDCQACGTPGATFHRLRGRRAYSCAHCGHHVYPCAGTIFQDSRTPLQVWFYAIYLLVATRQRIGGKELQRTLGVTYKTAWRMGRQIRQAGGRTGASGGGGASGGAGASGVSGLVKMKGAEGVRAAAV